MKIILTCQEKFCFKLLNDFLAHALKLASWNFVRLEIFVYPLKFVVAC